ncbi:hypothetical protein M0R89_07430 [Halorussus limi]|uniref:Uncharacterized protein n=1 Tax=Halorussus limi TaxID=2938695 RepID=A0A8U0HXR7_9EURY|nr:hypothetical protein [Halorussus limi]UPV75880.1 hypothetical protein M0R89_07430 [Halorussus limi]
MPYVKDSQSQPGYHVTAKPGSGHPINLKTRPVMDRIFQKMGFGTKTAISHDLCWALYDVGLLYTENSTETDDEREKISYKLTDLSLSAEQRDQLARLLQKYSNDDRIDSIKSLLADTEDFQERFRHTSPDEIEEDTLDNQFTDIVDELYDDSNTPFDDPEVTETLDEWGLSIQDVNGDPLSRTDLSERQAKAIEQSIKHPRKVDLGWDSLRVTDNYVEYTATGLHSEVGYYLADDTYIFKLRDYSTSLDEQSSISIETVVSWNPPSLDERVKMIRTYSESGFVFEKAFEPHWSDLITAGIGKAGLEEYRVVWTDIADRIVEE